MQNNRMIHRSPHVLWHPVGQSSDELLLMIEGAETALFIITGAVGAAIWMRLESDCTEAEIAAALAAACHLPLEDARKIVCDFLAALEGEGLVERGTAGPDRPSSGKHAIEWPEEVTVPQLHRFDPEAAVEENLVALGSFVGGRDNASGNRYCYGNVGGVGNFGGSQPCRPEQGFTNAGWVPVSCSDGS